MSKHVWHSAVCDISPRKSWLATLFAVLPGYPTSIPTHSHYGVLASLEFHWPLCPLVNMQHQLWEVLGIRRAGAENQGICSLPSSAFLYVASGWIVGPQLQRGRGSSTRTRPLSIPFRPGGEPSSCWCWSPGPECPHPSESPSPLRVVSTPVSTLYTLSVKIWISFSFICEPWKDNR